MHIRRGARQPGRHGIVGGNLLGRGGGPGAKAQRHRPLVLSSSRWRLQHRQLHEALNMASAWDLPVVFFARTISTGCRCRLLKVCKRSTWPPGPELTTSRAVVDGMDVRKCACSRPGVERAPGGRPFGRCSQNLCYSAIPILTRVLNARRRRSPVEVIATRSRSPRGCWPDQNGQPAEIEC
jgi:hypothetical protein